MFLISVTARYNVAVAERNNDADLRPLGVCDLWRKRQFTHKSLTSMRGQVNDDTAE